MRRIFVRHETRTQISLDTVVKLLMSCQNSDKCELKVSFLHDFRHLCKLVLSIGLRGKQACNGMIAFEILQKYGARKIKVEKDEVIFAEGDEAANFFQIMRGSVKMITTNGDGKEFIQGVFKTGDSFGEPALICSFSYPSSAIALEPTTVVKLGKDNFFKLLKENFEIHVKLDQLLCQRLRYKTMILSEISIYEPEHRISSLLKYLKKELSQKIKLQDEVVHDNSIMVIPYTRQQIADMIGLRVETVIRTIKKMQFEGKLQLIGRKIAL